jgi:phage gpG-like protein
MDYAKRVALAMMDPRVMNGIAQAVASIAKQHIAQGFGRGSDGGSSTLEPLKDITTEYWTTRKPKTGILGTRQVTQMRQRKSKDGRITVKPTKVTEYLVRGSSYRSGGQPLRDTGNLLRSLGARVRRIGPNRMEVILTGPQYGIFHELGFTTSGPNYIPLTRKGARQHSTGNDPRKEGLVPGKDYMMAWGGVTVPARPFLVPTAKEWGDVGRTIRLGLAKVLKGKR